MKYSFGQLKAYLANRRGAQSFSNLTAIVQSEALIRLHLLYEIIWTKKQWPFSGRKSSFATRSYYDTGTVSGSSGSKVLTGSSTSWYANMNGIPLAGQPIIINTREYTVEAVISTTKLILKSALLENISSGSSYKILFALYPLRLDVGALRSINRDNSDPVSVIPASDTSYDIEEGSARTLSNAGKLENDYYATGTVTIAANSNQATFSGSTLSTDMIGMALLEKTNYQVFYIVDVNTGTSVATLDRVNHGSAITGASFAINPEGTPLILVKPYPVSMQTINYDYTYVPPKLVQDNDMTHLPSDIPMIAGIDVIVTKWETVGERGFINEVMFQDKKFVESLRTLNARGGPKRLGMISLAMFQQKNSLRDTNPWNRRWS